MDLEFDLPYQSQKVEEKFKKATNKIKRTRKNNKRAQKDAIEFQEIHQLLEGTDEELLSPSATESKSSSGESNTNTLESSILPLSLPGVEIFHEELVFSLFNKNTCCLKNFVNPHKKFKILGLQESIPSEEWFRKIITYRTYENLKPENEANAPVSLYVLYLMSVHDKPSFVSACFDFLKFHPFFLCPEDIFPIFINFGGRREDLFDFSEDTVLRKFQNQNEDVRMDCGKIKFPFFNVEMVGQLLLHYITKDYFVINSEIKSFVNGLVKITLDPKIRAGALQPLYSIILTTLCLKLSKDHKLKEIASWLDLKNKHLLNQLEITRIVSKQIFPLLHEFLVLKTISDILRLRNFYLHIPLQMSYLKLILKKLRIKELPPLELYIILQLINSLLPGVTATVEDSVEINSILSSLERKLNKNEDSVDLIIQKLEIAKIGNLVTNNIKNRFVTDESFFTKETKCSK